MNVLLSHVVLKEKFLSYLVKWEDRIHACKDLFSKEKTTCLLVLKQGLGLPSSDRLS